MKTTTQHRKTPNFALPDEPLATGWKLSMRASGRSDKTLTTYLDTLDALRRFLAERGMPGLRELTTEHLREWFNDLYQRGNKPATVSVRYRALQQFFKWMVVEGERQENPLARVAPPKVPEVLQATYDPKDLETILNLIPQTARDLLTLRDRALLLFLYDSGVRGAEACGIMEDDVDWGELTVIIRQGKGGKQREVAIGNSAAQALERYLRRRKAAGINVDYLFSTREQGQMTPNAIRQILGRLFERAGVAFHGTHGLRRSWASQYLTAGGDGDTLQTLAGWSSPAMVRKYAKATQTERALKAHRRFSPASRLNLRKR
jgi:integrase/recombinase XerC